MASFPDDMLFYYHTTDGKTHYFSVCYKPKSNMVHIEEIEEDELFGIVAGDMELNEISPLDFPHKIPGNISGTVKAFFIK
jgi:hypothetical protein